MSSVSDPLRQLWENFGVPRVERDSEVGLTNKMNFAYEVSLSSISH